MNNNKIYCISIVALLMAQVSALGNEREFHNEVTRMTNEAVAHHEARRARLVADARSMCNIGPINHHGIKVMLEGLVAIYPEISAVDISNVILEAINRRSLMEQERQCCHKQLDALKQTEELCRLIRELPQESGLRIEVYRGSLIRMVNIADIYGTEILDTMTVPEIMASIPAKIAETDERIQELNAALSA